MNQRLRGYHHLDNLLACLEEEILKIDEEDLASESSGSTVDIRWLREVITAQVQSLGVTGQGSATPGGVEDDERLGNVQFDRAPVIPSDLSEQRKLLEILVAGQDRLPGQIRMAFSSRRKPSDTEVEEMVESLIRLGILSARDDDN